MYHFYSVQYLKYLSLFILYLYFFLFGVLLIKSENLFPICSLERDTISIRMGKKLFQIKSHFGAEGLIMEILLIMNLMFNNN